uniref:G-protein coupled receptors family 2 profile 2 domain-containing protein n=1 Tax=Branchiostoma floridae TaxID=7739 RepID=C3XRH1_BRAFL|eukprot:XP_002613280.1 hypothetical protein BRAFLDRAFT_68245 [Branchiostoma floridae]
MKRTRSDQFAAIVLAIFVVFTTDLLLTVTEVHGQDSNTECKWSLFGDGQNLYRRTSHIDWGNTQWNIVPVEICWGGGWRCSIDSEWFLEDGRWKTLSSLETYRNSGDVFRISYQDVTRGRCRRKRFVEWKVNSSDATLTGLVIKLNIICNLTFYTFTHSHTDCLILRPAGNELNSTNATSVESNTIGADDCGWGFVDGKQTLYRRTTPLHWGDTDWPTTNVTKIQISPDFCDAWTCSVREQFFSSNGQWRALSFLGQEGVSDDIFHLFYKDKRHLGNCSRQWFVQTNDHINKVHSGGYYKYIIIIRYNAQLHLFTANGIPYATPHLHTNHHPHNLSSHHKYREVDPEDVLLEMTDGLVSEKPVEAFDIIKIINIIGVILERQEDEMQFSNVTQGGQEHMRESLIEFAKRIIKSSSSLLKNALNMDWMSIEPLDRRIEAAAALLAKVEKLGILLASKLPNNTISIIDENIVFAVGVIFKKNPTFPDPTKLLNTSWSGVTDSITLPQTDHHAVATLYKTIHLYLNSSSNQVKSVNSRVIATTLVNGTISDGDRITIFLEHDQVNLGFLIMTMRLVYIQRTNRELTNTNTDKSSDKQGRGKKFSLLTKTQGVEGLEANNSSSECTWTLADHEQYLYRRTSQIRWPDQNWPVVSPETCWGWKCFITSQKFLQNGQWEDLSSLGDGVLDNAFTIAHEESRQAQHCRRLWFVQWEVTSNITRLDGMDIYVDVTCTLSFLGNMHTKTNCLTLRTTEKLIAETLETASDMTITSTAQPRSSRANGECNWTFADDSQHLYRRTTPVRWSNTDWPTSQVTKMKISPAFCGPWSCSVSTQRFLDNGQWRSLTSLGQDVAGDIFDIAYNDVVNEGNCTREWFVKIEVLFLVYRTLNYHAHNNYMAVNFKQQYHLVSNNDKINFGEEHFRAYYLNTATNYNKFYFVPYVSILLNGDIITIVRMLSTLVEIQERQLENVPQEERKGIATDFTQAMVQCGSIVLKDKYRSAWNEVPSGAQPKLAASLSDSMEKAGLLLAKTAPTEEISISQENVVMDIVPASTGNATYPNLTKADGCTAKVTDDGHTICECNHLTNFAILVDVIGHKTVCTVIAIALHYLFLAVFAWMCVEGIELYIILVKIFNLKNSRMVYYYLLGYGEHWSPNHDAQNHPHQEIQSETRRVSWKKDKLNVNV